MTTGYIAGFVDAEGCIVLRVARRKAEVEVVNVHRETLAIMRAHLGDLGVIRPRIGQRLGRQQQWKWVVSGNRQVRELLTTLLPHLIQKREKAVRALALLDR